MNIVKENYKNEGNLVQRTSFHDKYSTNKLGFGNWIVSNYQIKPGYKILELGCGNGALWKNHIDLLKGCEIVLSDFSEGMLKAAQKNIGNLDNVSYRIIDIQDISFEADSFDMIIANSMLYHVSDIDRGLSEVRRVLKDDGYFYCSTYGEHGHTEYIVKALESFGVTNIINQRFTLQNGSGFLQRHFAEVCKLEYKDSFCITNIDDLIEYMYSCVSMSNVKSVPQNDMKAFLEEKMENGILTIPKEYGMFICKAI